MRDTDFERGKATPLVLQVESIAVEAIARSMDNLTDKALQTLFTLVSVVSTSLDVEKVLEARGMLERMVGTMTDQEFDILDEQVTAAFERRFDPVAGSFI